MIAIKIELRVVILDHLVKLEDRVLNNLDDFDCDWPYLYDFRYSCFVFRLYDIGVSFSIRTSNVSVYVVGKKKKKRLKESLENQVITFEGLIIVWHYAGAELEIYL